MFLPQNTSQLIYLHDPMCSWCWAYKPTWHQLVQSLNADFPKLDIAYLLGGLAPDTDLPMPESQRLQIQQIWRRIQGELGTTFNFDFWQQNTPRRATELACKAVLAASWQSKAAERTMLEAIQRAYYLKAQNPSDKSLLLSLAQKLAIEGWDYVQFALDFDSQKLKQHYLEQITLARQISCEGFPSLRLWHQGRIYPIALDYQRMQVSLSAIAQVLET